MADIYHSPVWDEDLIESLDISTPINHRTRHRSSLVLFLPID